MLFVEILAVILLCLANVSYASTEEIYAKTQDNNIDLNGLTSYSVSYDDGEGTYTSKTVMGALKDVSLKAKVGASAYDSSYDMRNRVFMEVKDQGNTEECWAFSALESMETNLKMKYGRSPDFSERHMDYATSNSFYNSYNDKGFERKTTDGGSSIISMAYLTNGQGAVLEEEMPFENNMNNIDINEIDIDPSYYVKSYIHFPSIYKTINGNSITYSDGVSKVYSDNEVNNIRNLIKEHLVENGSVVAYTSVDSFQCYNNPNDPTKSYAYFNGDGNNGVNHAVSIVGWDDNYSKDNFTGSYKPIHNGAYLVKNSYSDQLFDGGYLWISYDDVWIESELYGITESSQINYKNLYQNDFYGANIPITLYTPEGGITEGYIAGTYERDSSQDELLTEVSVSTNQKTRFEVYIDTENDDLEDLVHVASTEYLNPGYNTIKIDPVILTGDKFSIVIKQETENNEDCFFMIEAFVDNTFYSRASSEEGQSRVSLDGDTWYYLGSLGTIEYGDYEVNLETADVCIKGFTIENSILSDEYEITKDFYITRIYDNTIITDFINRIDFNNQEARFFLEDGTEITDFNNSYVITGMKMRVGDEEYILVVRGDINGDGRISIVDLSKHIAHYAEIPGFQLEGASEKAGDINLDGEFSLIDVSQLLKLFNEM